MDQKISSLLAGISPTINFEDQQEDYILTDDEANAAIEFEIQRLEHHFEWKLNWKSAIVNPHAKASKLDKLDVSGEINVVEILERANSNKNYSIWQENQRKKERDEVEQKKEEVKRIWTANKVYQHIKWVSETRFKKQLIANADTMSIIKPLCYFLSEDERFETELGYSLGKGIMFRGISGLGKTYIVQCAESNGRQPISIVSMLEIASEVRQEGEYNPPLGLSKLYLDDVGSEEHIQNHYGTKINWFKDFMETFYLRNKQYNKLIISSNISFKEIEEKYGFRVRSRFKDMFNVIDVNGEDLRG